MSLIGCLLIPLYCLFGVLNHSLPVLVHAPQEVHEPQAALSTCMSLIGCLLIPLYRLFGVLRHSLPVLVHAACLNNSTAFSKSRFTPSPFSYMTPELKMSSRRRTLSISSFFVFRFSFISFALLGRSCLRFERSCLRFERSCFFLSERSRVSLALGACRSSKGCCILTKFLCMCVIILVGLYNNLSGSINSTNLSSLCGVDIVVVLAR
mmetsp:Transcript_34869/g.69276  ORF Transcript_34869/g.69276 Transcript_34869/m.69276 type:complete len:208 (-) Transcript_34869:219-842(-)